ncbi:MAG: hypothetical protein AAGD01_17380 [Acidobacteriota bacterium]
MSNKKLPDDAKPLQRFRAAFPGFFNTSSVYSGFEYQRDGDSARFLYESGQAVCEPVHGGGGYLMQGAFVPGGKVSTIDQSAGFKVVILDDKSGALSLDGSPAIVGILDIARANDARILFGGELDHLLSQRNRKFGRQRSRPCELHPNLYSIDGEFGLLTDPPVVEGNRIEVEFTFGDRGLRSDKGPVLKSFDIKKKFPSPDVDTDDWRSQLRGDFGTVGQPQEVKLAIDWVSAWRIDWYEKEEDLEWVFLVIYYPDSTERHRLVGALVRKWKQEHDGRVSEGDPRSGQRPGVFAAENQIVGSDP